MPEFDFDSGVTGIVIAAAIMIAIGGLSYALSHDCRWDASPWPTCKVK